MGDEHEADTSKGSFYYNPITDAPGTEQDRIDYPCSYPCNKWPKDGSNHAIPANFESLAKELGQLMYHVTVLLSKHIDAYMKENYEEYYTNDLLHDSLKDTEKVKCRLLYYYPNEENDKEDSWIGWHNDSGFLTALAGDIYIDNTTGKTLQNPDPNSGLYISDTTGKIHNIQIPNDCLAIQIGECSQIITGAKVRSTPHCVKASKGKNVARISLVCFVDAGGDFRLCVPKGCDLEDVLGCPLEGKVPPLGMRWSDGMKFGDFLDNTFRKFYNW